MGQGAEPFDTQTMASCSFAPALLLRNAKRASHQ
jgi:hypothetical protein